MSNEQVARQLICEHCGAPLTQPNLPAETRAILAELDNESDPSRIVMCDHCGYRNTLPPLPTPPLKPIPAPTQQEQTGNNEDSDEERPNREESGGRATTTAFIPHHPPYGLIFLMLLMLPMAGIALGLIPLPFKLPSAVIGITSTPNSTVAPSCTTPTSAPIQFQFMNAYSGVAWNGKATILDPANSYQQSEIPGEVTHGSWTTFSKYLTGSYWRMLLQNNNTLSEFDFTVPCDIPAAAWHAIIVYVVDAPTPKNIGLNIIDSNGEILTNNEVWNSSGITSPIFNVQFANKQDGTGWPGSSGVTNPANAIQAGSFQDKRTYDTVLDAYRTLDVAMVVRITGQPVLVLNMPLVYNGTSRQYYAQPFTALTPTGSSALDRYKLPSGIYDSSKTGMFVTSFQLSGLAAGAKSVITITLYFYADLKFLAQYGTMNSEAVIMQSFTFTMMTT